MATVTKKTTEVTYTIEKQPDASQKCPPQAKLIIDILSAQPNQTATRAELMALLKRDPADGGLKTTQTAEKILGFYQPKLEEQGILKVTKNVTETQVEAPDKPSKTKAAKGKKVDVATGEEVGASEDVDAEPSEVEEISAPKVGKGRRKVA